MITDQLIVRPVARRDVNSILAIYKPFITDGGVSFEEIVPSETQMWTRIEKNSIDYPWLVAIIKGQVVGYAYANAHRSRAAYRWACEGSIYVTPGSQGQGVGSTLYNALLDLLRYQGFCTALAGIVIPNDASCGFHKKAGI